MAQMPRGRKEEQGTGLTGQRALQRTALTPVDKLTDVCAVKTYKKVLVNVKNMSITQEAVNK